MVLLAAAICNRAGKVLISRQFVEMTRSRIEGLLAAFPKLMNSGKQHTFVETESVRYVYQPLEKLYVVLITTKASNILEDLETLRLFARVVPEYCKILDEAEIIDQAFPLIFAFDEIVALGYRESVNLAQIRTFTEMDSHEEKVYQAVRQTQEREARQEANRIAKELQAARRENQRSGRAGTGFSGGRSMGHQAVTNGSMMDMSPTEPPKPTYTPSKPTGSGKALKLGSKSKDVESFVDQLRSEGETVTTQNKSAAVVKSSVPAVNQDDVHVRIEEKITLAAGRDGGLQNMEIHGLAFIKVADEEHSKIQLHLKDTDHRGVQIQPHPNVDKRLFQSSSVIALKNPSKPFPIKQEAGILRWRLQTQDESFMPLSINCWPNDAGNTCDVNIEYDLEMSELELNDVTISIPLPSGVGSPNITVCDGDYHHDSRRNVLEWQVTIIDDENKTGSLEFAIPGQPDDFFPVVVNFVSKKSYCNIEISDAKVIESGESVSFSTETLLYVDKYEIV